MVIWVLSFSHRSERCKTKNMHSFYLYYGSYHFHIQVKDTKHALLLSVLWVLSFSRPGKRRKTKHALLICTICGDLTSQKMPHTPLNDLAAVPLTCFLYSQMSNRLVDLHSQLGFNIWQGKGTNVSIVLSIHLTVKYVMIWRMYQYLFCLVWVASLPDDLTLLQNFSFGCSCVIV